MLKIAVYVITIHYFSIASHVVCVCVHVCILCVCKYVHARLLQGDSYNGQLHEEGIE